MVTSFYCGRCALQNLQDRIIEIEPPFRIPFLLQTSQFLYPPGLISVHLLHRFVSIGIVDVGMELPSLLALDP